MGTRKPSLALITLTLVLTASLGMGACTGNRGGGVTPSPTGASTPATAPALLLVQALNESGYAINNVLLGTLPAPTQRSPRLAYLPGGLLVDGPGGPTTLGRTPFSPDTRAAVVAMTDTFAVSVTGGIALDRLALAGLIDAVGGIWINVPERLFIARPDQGLPLVVAPGWQRFTGISGADYATLLTPGGTQTQVLQRFAAVFAQIIRRLPVSDERLRQVFTNLGSLAPSTTTTDVLVSAFSQARDGELAGQDLSAIVDVAVIRDGEIPAAVVTERGSRTVAVMFADFAPTDREPLTPTRNESTTP